MKTRLFPKTNRIITITLLIKTHDKMINTFTLEGKIFEQLRMTKDVCATLSDELAVKIIINV